MHNEWKDTTQAVRDAEFLAFALELAERAGEAILPHFRVPVDVHNKAEGRGFDPVTEADRAAEAAMRAAIGERYPHHGIHGEEHGRSGEGAECTWVLDPIDGTRSFILGQLHWGILIALRRGPHPVVGVMHQPFVGETFLGGAGVAEWRRGGQSRPLRTRPCGRLADAAVCTTHPDLFRSRDERAAFDLIAARARLSRYGGDCYSYCLLAAGLVDLVIESGLQPYDVQALIPIVEGAGGAITSWSGGFAGEGGQVVASGDRRLHEQVLRVLSVAAAG